MVQVRGENLDLKKTPKLSEYEIYSYQWFWEKKEGGNKATLIDELDKEYVNEFSCVNISLLIKGSLLF